MNTGFGLEEAVREARERTGVPGVAAGLLRDGETVFAADGVLELGRDEAVCPETPFRIASITKPFTATLCAASVGLDERLQALLSHTAGLRCESAQPLPHEAIGLWSYSNAGYWEARAHVRRAVRRGDGDARARAARSRRRPASHEPDAPARGHMQEGESGHRAVSVDAIRRRAGRRAGSGRRSATCCASRRTTSTARRQRCTSLAAERARCALRARLVGARARGRPTTLDHEGSIAGYQSLLLLVPSEVDSRLRC